MLQGDTRRVTLLSPITFRLNLTSFEQRLQRCYRSTSATPMLYPNGYCRWDCGVGYIPGVIQRGYSLRSCGCVTHCIQVGIL